MFLKKIFRSLIILGFFVFISFGFIRAQEAIVLSDSQLDDISAAGFDIDINAVEAFRSAVIAQSNIGAVKGFGLSNISLNNSNLGSINNIGNSGVGLQSNIAAVVAEKGNINGATINNSNILDIKNTGGQPGAVSASLINADLSSGLAAVNKVYADNSAVATQSNIAVMAALGGDITNSFINNRNFAALNNLGNAALAAQTNIAVVVARGNIDNVAINNLNEALVTNTANAAGGAQVQSFNYSGLLGSLYVNNLSISYSAQAAQANIAVIVSLGSGHVTNSSVNSSNIATVINTH